MRVLVSDPKQTQKRDPKAPREVIFEGRTYPLLWTPSGWRLRSKAKTHPAAFRTGTLNPADAVRLSKEWLAKHANDPRKTRKGGGYAIALVEIFMSSDEKRANKETAKDYVGALRTICQFTLGRELREVRCSELGPELWKAYQRKRIAEAGLEWDRSTPRKINGSINARLRNATAIFQPALIREYRAAGLGVSDDSGAFVELKELKQRPPAVDDAGLIAKWKTLRETNLPMWLTIGLARFAGLRQQEIAHCAAKWIKDGAILMEFREEAPTKTAEIYDAPIIEPELRAWIAQFVGENPPDTLIVQNTPRTRKEWFTREPQKWLRSIGFKIRAPLHRLRGLYGDNLLDLNKDAILARQEALKAASKALGHTTTATTENHYLTR